MKYLKIQNDGLLDIRLVALMGGTTKSNDIFKIGQFGTGLKYTLAFLYRNNLDFKIFVGNNEVKIHLENEEIRNEVFEIICINGNRTSITTKMGEDWLAWMIIRELWCNALDEGGAKKDVTDVPAGEEGKTTFYIQLDRQIDDVVKNWSKYFIHDEEPIFCVNDYKIYPGGNSIRFYKNGVLIHEDDKKKALYSYDIAGAEINELREYRGNLAYPVVMSLSAMAKENVVCFLEAMTEDHYEGQMDWSWYQTMSLGWKEAIGSAKIITQKTLDTIRARGLNPDEASLLILPESLYKKLINSFEGVSATYVSSVISDFYEDFDADVESKINQALAILEHCNYKFHPELTFVYGFFEDKTTLAKIDIKAKKVFISKAFLQKPLYETVAMLIEENEHFNTGLGDVTRAFQQHFINLYTRELLARNEVEI